MRLVVTIVLLRSKAISDVAKARIGTVVTLCAEEVARLRFIRAAQATGFSLEDVATLLALRDDTTQPCREVQDLIEDLSHGDHGP